MKLIAGSSNLPLAQLMAKQLNVELIDVAYNQFINGEQRVWIKDSVKDERVIIVQSFSDPVDTHIFETLLIIDALQRAAAKSMELVIPWLGYSLQDKVVNPGEPIPAQVVADIISGTKIDQLYLLELHDEHILEYFSVPTVNLSAVDVFVRYAQQHLVNDSTVVASPDHGGEKRANAFAQQLQLPVIKIAKHRDQLTGQIESMVVDGEVVGKTVLLIDDAIQSGRTAVAAAAQLRQAGAKQIVLFVTHGPMATAAYQKVAASQFDQIITTNSIAHPQDVAKMTVLDISQVFVTAIKE